MSVVMNKNKRLFQKAGKCIVSAFENWTNSEKETDYTKLMDIEDDLVSALEAIRKLLDEKS